ncbi:hypothetical protein O6H91_14G028600 [Diphasiastrum complanatum]|uniref:Uncharacterized protein n=2 Tax=Diphasiastrum complanatum TaxID=34168 RepID=A0ACC2BLP8_DIPCM|nr:hypothetical protein O6H91_14G014600 [Diphasiastrum complanatum]KAJ7531011.1 hypothetical protein O6H91_14G028600 [Diphasiastrum complanatum]
MQRFQRFECRLDQQVEQNTLHMSQIQKSMQSSIIRFFKLQNEIFLKLQNETTQVKQPSKNLMVKSSLIFKNATFDFPTTLATSTSTNHKTYFESGYPKRVPSTVNQL